MYAEIPNCSVENRNKSDMTHLIGQSRMALLLHSYINDTFSHMHCSLLLFTYPYFLINQETNLQTNLI